jgi:hypothetical protein
LIIPNWEECRKKSEIIGAKLSELIEKLGWGGSNFYCAIYRTFFNEEYYSITQRLEFESFLNASVCSKKGGVRNYYSTETLKDLIYVEEPILKYIEQNYDSISENNLKPENVIRETSKLISSKEYKVKPVTFK